MLYIDRYEDYKLKGNITDFEAYLFATKEKFWKRHTSLEESLYLIDGSVLQGIFGFVVDKDDRNIRVTKIPMEHLEERQTAESILNHEMKQVFDNYEAEYENAERYSNIRFTIVDGSDNYDPKELQETYDFIVERFYEFLCKTNKIGVIVPHFHQDDLLPYVHMLYNRTDDKYNEFNDFMDEYLEKASESED